MKFGTPKLPAKYPGSSGVVVGLWYLALFGIVISRSGRPPMNVSVAPVLAVAAAGVLTVIGCVRSLSKRTAVPQ